MDNPNKETEDTPVFVLVPTCDRPELLLDRSLPAAVAQSYPLAGIVVVDDSVDQTSKAHVLRAVKKLSTEELPIHLMDNNRTPGAAGAWNTGAEWIASRDPSSWIAFLDDDDEWDAEHIAECIRVSRDGDAVISGIQTVVDGKTVPWERPDGLSEKAFFSGNPGWQGSNTFIRADAFWKIGGFDETLLCTHDRDLAVRFLDRQDLSYVQTDCKTVTYHLDGKRPSLTSRRTGKWTGLLQFWKKHSEKMDADDRKAFVERAERLFDMPPYLFEMVCRSHQDTPGFPPLPPPPSSTSARGMDFVSTRLGRIAGCLRTMGAVTKALGYRYSRSRKRIEIDITYDCNLKCVGCNRSCGQAPDALHISVNDIQSFVQESLKRKTEWEWIRVLGGEPTMHPDFEEILYALLEYKRRNPTCRLTVVTNGHGSKVRRMLMRVPPAIHIENTCKGSREQKRFIAFNAAPCDIPMASMTDFANGCPVLESCGIGLTPLGYYPCALAGGIDRIAGLGLGAEKIPDTADDMRDTLGKLCRYCGRFRSRAIGQDSLKKQDPARQSPTWKEFYAAWKDRGERIDA